MDPVGIIYSQEYTVNDAQSITGHYALIGTLLFIVTTSGNNLQ